MRVTLVAMLGVLLAAGAGERGRGEDISKITIPETSTVEVLPPVGPERVYLLDMVYPHPIVGRVMVVDGAAQRVLGSITAGLMPNLVIVPGQKEVLVLGTFWSRAAYGERADVLTYYDASTLTPTAEVLLPGRFLIADKGHNVDLTTDGRYLLVSNMTPATSVIVIDVARRTVVGSIETPGCTFVYPAGPSRFASLCADGSLFTATFDAAGKVTAAQRSKPFFDVQNDPLFEHAGLDRRANTANFVSYLGQVMSVDLAASSPVFHEPWSMVSSAEARKGWRPGGWQLVALHRESDRLYVLMHRGGPWTHKQSGTEVWVLDLATHRRVSQIKLKAPAGSIAVSQEPSDPKLYALTEHELYTYDTRTGEVLGKLKEMGDTPLEIDLYDR